MIGGDLIQAFEFSLAFFSIWAFKESLDAATVGDSAGFARKIGVAALLFILAYLVTYFL